MRRSFAILFLVTLFGITMTTGCRQPPCACGTNPYAPNSYSPAVNPGFANTPTAAAPYNGSVPNQAAPSYTQGSGSQGTPVFQGSGSR